MVRKKVVLKPLAISCNNADCDNDLHCFNKSRRDATLFPDGVCKYCGADLINWERVHLRSLGDIEFTIEALEKEWIRHHFWHVEIPQKAINYALRKGSVALKDSIRSRLNSSVALAKPFHDGIQTPFESNNPIHYAQHATASCCRKCIEKWHGIERGKDLNEEEITYLTQLIMEYIKIKLPNLGNEPQKIPSIRRKIRSTK
jgi:hypothetical protein